MAQPRVALADVDEDAFNRTWNRTDLPIAAGRVSRSWIWGDPQNGFRLYTTEPYANSPGGVRNVRYFDKSRMEITCSVTECPDLDPDGPWYVTNGLLVMELITGRLQLGNDQFEQRLPAVVNVAGDSDDPTGPTYATFAGLLNAGPLGDGSVITQRVDRAGNVWTDDSLAVRGVTAATYVLETNHRVATPFWEFMNSSGLVYQDGQYVNDALFLNSYYATGFPVTEAYWANVKVDGTYKDVLMQCFERRCLTYTPENEPVWRVEMGNVGQHYYDWRYCDPGGEVLWEWDRTTEPSDSWDTGSAAYNADEDAYIVEEHADDVFYSRFKVSDVSIPQDFILTVDVVNLGNDPTAASEGGVLYRLESDESGWTEAINTGLGMDGNVNSWYLGPTEGVELAQSHATAFRTGYAAVNRISIVVQGSLARVHVNGSFVHEFRFDARIDLTANGFGIMVWRFAGSPETVTRVGFRTLVAQRLLATSC
jgi:hypothetical protein